MTQERFAIASGSTQLAGISRGRGTPVVFLHAGVADARMWRDQLDALAPHARGADRAYHAIAYDRRGFGSTPHTQERFSQVADLTAVLDAHTPCEPAILVGSSQGGRIAIDTALAAPARIRALVLVAPAIGGAPRVSLPPRIQDLVDDLDRAEREGDLDRVNALEAQAWLDGPLERNGRVSGEARELFLDMNGRALRARLLGEEIAAAPAYSRVGEIAVPTLIIRGRLDFPHVARQCDHLATTVRFARLFTFADAAHLPNLEYPLRFNRTLEEFLEGLS